MQADEQREVSAMDRGNIAVVVGMKTVSSVCVCVASYLYPIWLYISWLCHDVCIEQGFFLYLSRYFLKILIGRAK